MATERRTPGVWTKVFYGFGSVAFGVKDNGFGLFLLIYYNQVLGLPEAWVGFGIMIALIADALFDPLVGYLSDHLRTPWGRRHPLMYAAAVPVGISYYFLWNPPAGLSQGALFFYFVALAILVRILIACYEIPSSALVAELTDQYDERTAILSYRYFFGWWGGLAVAVLAYSVFLTPDAAHPVGVLKPSGYELYGTVAAVIMTAAIIISAMGTHGYIPYLRQPPEMQHRGVSGAISEFRQTLATRSFFALFGAGIFGGMGAGITIALTVYFNTYFWQLSSEQMSLLAVLNFVSAAVAFAVTAGLSVRYGKRKAAIGAALIVIIFGPAPIILRVLGLFPANGSPMLMPTLAVINTILVALFIVASILITSMLADVVEESEVKTGRRSEGVFFAANAFVQKSVSGIGIFASTLLLNAIDFPRGAQPGEVAPETVRNLGLVYAPTFVVLFLLMLGCVATYRISRATHEENLQRLGR
jgi:glycoside/pentoside/hexuronide:cation symporter, GPH family